MKCVAQIAGKVEIPISEFLTYFLFHRKRPGMAGWRTFTEVERKIDVAITNFKLDTTRVEPGIRQGLGDGLKQPAIQ